jgi:2-deoxy-D-gluconate 3-dehydrogenase
MAMAGILDSFRLDGRVAIVTGASRGLGSGMAEALAEAGADVVAVARGSTSSLKARVERLGRRFHAVRVDVAEAGSAAAILAECERVLGGADILVNNAGIIRRAPFLEFSEKDWKDVLDVNLTAAFRLSQEFARRLVARKASGKIINIASMLSFQGGVRVASYTASKGALHSLTMLMANELAPLGINVNAIAPGYMATDNTEQLRADAARNKAILERIPAGRWGTPEDLKGAVVFLSSGASDYMHGFTVAVDGGWLGR